MNQITDQANKKRKTNHNIVPLISGRWSPRSMSGESLKEEEFMPLFEAARWAPSSYNNQPWRFVYATRDSADWQKFIALMSQWNRMWTKNAALLVVALSKKTFEHNGKPSRTHSFDTGAAWQNLALEGVSRGLVVHAMEGFDYDLAKTSLGIPDDYEVHAMIAIGRLGKRDDLTDPKMHEREEPNDRRPLKEIIMQGKFRK